MSALEYFFVALAVAGAAFYLARRAWRRFAGRGTGCCGNCPVGPRRDPAGRSGHAGVYSGVKKSVLLVFLAIPFFAAGAAGQLSKKQMKDAERMAALTVPSPSEFFAAIDKAGKPDWMSFYREPAPTTYPTRPRTAINLGALVTDGYVAVEAQDGQQVKNTGKDIIALARALGVGEDVLMRGKSITDFADKNDWFALREELEATTNEVRRAMNNQRDEVLASLITAGAWLRALEVGSRAAEMTGEEDAAGLLRQPALVGWLRSELQQLPENARGGPDLTKTDMTLMAVEETMDVPDGEDFGSKQVSVIREATAQFLAEMSAKEP